MVRNVASFVVCLTLLAACWNREAYELHLEGPMEKTAAPISKDEGQTEKPVLSNDNSPKKRFIESLPSNGHYLNVTGDALIQASEAFDGQLLRIDATLVWISPGVEAGMSTFETRDERFEFEVSWGEPNSMKDTKKIMKIKKRILKNYSNSKFRLYGRWEHEDSLFHNYRVLNVDKWEIVEW